MYSTTGYSEVSIREGIITLMREVPKKEAQLLKSTGRNFGGEVCLMSDDEIDKFKQKGYRVFKYGYECW